jgi:very-short-patch-repair endonuclease
MGDGVLIEFASVVDALECAVNVQRGMSERNAEVPEDRRIVLRIPALAHAVGRHWRPHRYPPERPRSAIHGDHYDYSLVQYQGIKNLVKIICPKHGPFMQRAEGHLDGNGCPKCSTSTGERAISEILEGIGIKFEIEKRFEGCRRVHLLPFDFYLPDHGVLIEYDGAQHFVLAGWFDTEERAKESLALIQERDAIKTAWAASEGVPLHRIRYDEDVRERMEHILSNLGPMD